MADQQIMLTSSTERKRLVKSVHFTEQYQDRIKGLLELQTPPPQNTKSVQPIRAMLLQDCFDGNDALAVQIGRDGTHYGYLVSIVGDNNVNYAVPSVEYFTLDIIGVKPNLVAANVGSDFVLLGTTDPLLFDSIEDDFVEAFNRIDSRFDFSNMTANFGNPYVDDQLIQYGNVTSEKFKDGSTHLVSPVGAWLITINDDVLTEYAAVQLKLNAVNASALSGVTVELITDLPSTTTVVTDIDYRTKDYPWQAGTIVTCLDFMDIGYGIIRSSTRNLKTTLPVS